jgi:dTMP kinase
MTAKRCYFSPPPGVDLSRLTGTLIVIEGPDASGRSTHIVQLTKWLEEEGYAVVHVGLRRSMLVSPELDRAKKGNVVSPRTMSLFYAADFYDQMENVLVPALQAGAVALADRYIFTLMARDLVRGAEPHWVESLYSRALVPDAVFFLKVSRETQAVRSLKARGGLDYWESGMDLRLSRDWFDCFVKYQTRLAQVFAGFQEKHGFEVVNANRSLKAIQSDLRAHLRRVLAGLKA